MKPKLSVRTPSGLPHDGLDVSVHIKNSVGETKTIKLPWDADSQYYTGNEFYSAETLGEVDFTFEIKWLVSDLGSELHYSVVQHKTIGYKVRVTSNAEIAGKTVEEGGDIGIGTHFDFALSLETRKERNLLSGDFIVSVLTIFKSRLTLLLKILLVKQSLHKASTVLKTAIQFDFHMT